MIILYLLVKIVTIFFEFLITLILFNENFARPVDALPGQEIAYL